MKNMKKFLAVCMFGALALVGCSQSSSQTVVNTETKTETNNVSGQTQEVANNKTDAAEQTKVEDTKNVQEYPFTYVDATGEEVIIEKKPEKIAVAYLPHWEYLIALGKQPVAATRVEYYKSTWVPFESYDVSSVIELGDGEINLEKLAEVAPDLIILASYDAGVENLKKIAPVVVMDTKVKMDWRHGLREIAKVIGESETAEQKIQEVDQKLLQAKEKFEKEYAGETVMIVSLMGKDKLFSARRPDFFDAETGLGLIAPEGYPEENNYEQVALEAFAQMDPDHIFLAVFDGDEAIAEELNDQAIWQSLQASQNGQVYILNGAAHSPSVLSTEYTVDKIVEILLGE
jgi:iron complex transport system substrate-binding protein